MPHVAPTDYPLTKNLPNLAVSVTYTQVSGSPNELDCLIELRNTKRQNETHKTSNGHKSASELNTDDNTLVEDGEEVEDEDEDEDELVNESQKLTTESEDTSIFLGYIQLLGYVRLNNDFAGSGLSRDLFWKNADYLTRYRTENEHDKVEAILQTPLFNENDHLCSFRNKLAGWPDFKNGPSDDISVGLLHDLAHSFNSGEPLSGDHAGVSLQESASIASEFSQYIVPFYITLQHLLFSSIKIRPGEVESFKRRVKIPSHELPPSYNMALTGFSGDNGLVSICYNLVVGLLNETSKGMTLRSLYFPWRFSPAQIRTERGWSQPDYLQKPIVDKDWLPQVIDSRDSKNKDTLHKANETGSTATNISSEIPKIQKTDNENHQELTSKPKERCAAKENLQAELANLMSSTVEMVATTERRKSSVSIMKRDENGYIPQIPAKSRVSYQIKVNNQLLCQALMSKATYRVGEDIHFCLDVPSAKSFNTRVVGAVAHVEAHEVFHIDETRKLVNVFKVTPAIKVNTYANALAIFSDETSSSAVSSMLNLPLYLAQQFQASTFMDLKYFLVFSLVLNDFDTEHLIVSLDQEGEKAVSEFLQVYKSESEFHKFKFSVPLTVMP